MSSPQHATASGARLKILAAARTASAILLLAMFALAIGYKGHVPVVLALAFWIVAAAALLFLALWKQARGVGKVFDGSYVGFLAVVVLFGVFITFL